MRSEDTGCWLQEEARGAPNFPLPLRGEGCWRCCSMFPIAGLESNNGDQLVVPHQQLPRLQLGSIFLLNDCLPVTYPRPHSEERPLQTVFQRGAKNPTHVVWHVHLKSIKVCHLSMSSVLQLVASFLVISTMAIQISLIPHLEPMSEEIGYYRSSPRH